ncbi:MAG: hypothetical protein IJW44_03345 [Clostridia bacterium]|nr:hypothetical protein [Clostridia bacterium]
MNHISVKFDQQVGRIKPMHAVNNGPVYKFAADQRITNLDAFVEAGIPYARNHDASFYAIYGGNHTVDVAFIFPNFDADPYDPASYDFACTDEYMKVMYYAGVKCFYRLGHRIEHEVKKYGTLPPKDFKKWAVVCEHIIRHYTEGWANGFTYDVEYWEIWNEPDLDPDDSPNKRTWGGTQAEFFELYHITATHLKACFPHLKIGGPALAGKMDWAEAFLAQLKAPLDFFSWHRYSATTEKIALRAKETRALLDKYGFTETESILNEWNYVRSFKGDDWLYSLRQEKGLKGAAFTASVMCDSQAGPVDLLMYYDARPCGMNGMFSTDFVCDKLKGYYPFLAFNSLYKLGNCVASESDDGSVHVCAAVGETEAAVMLTHFNDDDATEPMTVSVDLSGFGSADGVSVELYTLDETHDLEQVDKYTYYGNRFPPQLTLPNFTTYLLKLKKN